jgi:hypothetical protein
MNSLFRKKVIPTLLQRMEQETFVKDFEKSEEGKIIYNKKIVRKAIEEFKDLLKKNVLSDEDLRKEIMSGREYVIITLFNKELWIPKKYFDLFLNLANSKPIDVKVYRPFNNPLIRRPLI